MTQMAWWKRPIIVGKAVFSQSGLAASTWQYLEVRFSVLNHWNPASASKCRQCTEEVEHRRGSRRSACGNQRRTGVTRPSFAPVHPVNNSKARMQARSRQIPAFDQLSVL
ncbi:hypothetical protein T4D_11049 [Trichinella pseudospiralis]|uniref:Uncharacterized protein n=1 Tax=Trichinella pseudospiralis TaxID=6337 RepID=A0A0V1FTQ9_TRIPS|nr:hypothetical protein T4D_11049 [Trichinella pseudospiralis]